MLRNKTVINKLANFFFIFEPIIIFRLPKKKQRSFVSQSLLFTTPSIRISLNILDCHSGYYQNLSDSLILLNNLF